MTGKNKCNSSEIWNSLIRGAIKTEQITDPQLISLKISLLYMFMGALWILLSDKVLDLLVSSKQLMTLISMIKGWLYVFVTGIIIYSLIYTALKRIKNAEEELFESYRQLAAGQEKLHHLAYHDPLTGLPNRLSLTDLKPLSEIEADKTKGTLLFIDIDNFKNINDTLGHSFGDHLITVIGRKLDALLTDKCTIYRLGGDEFVVFTRVLNSSKEGEDLARRILQSLQTPIELNGSIFNLTASIGISLCPEHGTNINELLKYADIAMYRAKEQGKNGFVFYNKSMVDPVVERMNIEKNLRNALENKEFILHFQPQLNIATGEISGFEALLRWNSPQMGFVAPDKFIKIAEDTHLIIPIGDWVLKNACSFIKRLQSPGLSQYTISVNISIMQLLQEDFVDKVMHVLEYVDLDPSLLELEITETMLVQSFDIIGGKLELLKQKGVRIALDDFGTGYSSLNYLKQLPISTIKIDKSFIDNIPYVDKKEDLTGHIVNIGLMMGLCVVAEGVETQAQLDYLKEHKCNKIQGFLFSKPVSEAEARMLIL